jgi:hypothetical protein
MTVEPGHSGIHISARRSHSIGSSFADDHVAAVAAAAPGVSVQRSSSSGPGVTDASSSSTSRVRRSSCEASMVAAIARWPRHSHPGPAYAH